MPYKLVSDHNGGTFKEIALASNIDFSRGAGLYQLVKKEKVSKAKQLVLFKNDKFFLEDSANIRTVCGVNVSGEVTIEPKNVPANHKLFVQSTSSSRKIPKECAVLIVVDALEDNDEGDGAESDNDADVCNKKQKVAEFAVDFDAVFALLDTDECTEELSDCFHVETGGMCNVTDERVSEDAVKESAYNLSLLFAVDWEDEYFVFEAEIKSEGQVDLNRGCVKASAQGYLAVYDGAERDIPVRVEYSNSRDNYVCFAVSIGNKWGLISGWDCDHPFVVSNEIYYCNSDGTSQEQLPPYLPSTSVACTDADGTADTELIRAANMLQINAIISHGLKWFHTNCSH